MFVGLQSKGSEKWCFSTQHFLLPQAQLKTSLILNNCHNNSTMERSVSVLGWVHPNPTCSVVPHINVAGKISTDKTNTQASRIPHLSPLFTASYLRRPMRDMGMNKIKERKSIVHFMQPVDSHLSASHKILHKNKHKLEACSNGEMKKESFEMNRSKQCINGKPPLCLAFTQSFAKI